MPSIRAQQATGSRGNDPVHSSMQDALCGGNNHQQMPSSRSFGRAEAAAGSLLKATVPVASTAAAQQASHANEPALRNEECNVQTNNRSILVSDKRCSFRHVWWFHRRPSACAARAMDATGRQLRHCCCPRPQIPQIRKSIPLQQQKLIVCLSCARGAVQMDATGRTTEALLLSSPTKNTNKESNSAAAADRVSFVCARRSADGGGGAAAN